MTNVIIRNRSGLILSAGKMTRFAAGRLPRFAYFPFGGGPRVCIGAGFAMMEATLLLATIAQRYSFSLPPDSIVKPLFSITLRPKDGLTMRLHRRR